MFRILKSLIKYYVMFYAIFKSESQNVVKKSMRKTNAYSTMHSVFSHIQSMRRYTPLFIYELLRKKLSRKNNQETSIILRAVA